MVDGAYPTDGVGDPPVPVFAPDARFALIRKLGHGGMGVVYEALDRERNERVALKRLPTLDADALLRFKREFRAMQDLRHPNLVKLEELFEIDGEWFFTMELVDGIDVVRFVRGMDVTGAGTTPDSTTRVSDAEGPTTVEKDEDHGALHSGVRAALAAVQIDGVRLRDALVQISRGLMALHAAHKVHRDIKPSNILVTAAGTVKILDFGVVFDEALGGRDLDRGYVVGTPAYMAPEQAAGETIRPEADWYSVGVLLYLFLTGALPFSGPSRVVLRAKQLDEPLPPSTRRGDVPPELDALCSRLLRLDPRQRATGRDVLELLAPEAPSGDVRAEAFVGRETELQSLRDAFHRARHEQLSVLIDGESGVGKSALVSQFTSELRRSDRSAVVLYGRCYELESVRFKAFDAIVDALSEELRSVGEDQQKLLLPVDAALLAHVFPVLRRIEAVKRLPDAPAARVDPQMLRSRVFAALRSLLARLAEIRSVAVVIDDLQWSDADGLALLREVLRPPDAPRVLLIATLRPSAHTAAVTQSVPGRVEHVALGGLPADKARDLVAHLLANVPDCEHRARAEAIAAESAGHPLFLAELVQHALASGSAPANAPPRLEAALAARLGRLDPVALDVLETIAVAEAPLTLSEVARASGLEMSALSTHVSSLRADRLARTSGARRADRVEPYHDRVRASVLALLDEASRRGRHARIAAAIEIEEPDAHEALATHWASAGRRHEALAHAVIAAERAGAVYAFNRAADFYRLAISLASPAEAHERQLEASLGRALAFAGHGFEAAQALRAAARGATGSKSLELRRHAAQQLLSSGHIDEGLRELRGVLGEAGFSYPSTTRAAVASLLWHRARNRLRGLEFREGASASVEQLERVDVVWAAVVGLSMIDTIRGADYQARYLRLALDAGEPCRIRALAWEMSMDTAMGADARAKALGDAAREVSRRLDDPPQLRALIAACSVVASYLTARWREVRRLMSEVEEMSQSEWSDAARYELDNGRMLALASITYMGQVKAFHRELPPLLADARERNNVHIISNLISGMNVINWLAVGKPREVASMLDEAIGYWSPSRVNIPHFIDLYGRTQLALFEGDGAGALERMSAWWPLIDKAFLLHGPFVRFNLLDLRARSAVAAAARTTGSPRRAFLRSARRDAQSLERGGLPWWTRPMAALVRAGIAALEDDTEGAVTHLRYGASGFQDADMSLHAACAREVLATVVQGSEGRALREKAQAWFSEQGITAARGVCRVLVPGFGLEAGGDGPA